MEQIFCTCCARLIARPRMLRKDMRIGAFHNLAIPEEHAGELAPFGSRCAPRVIADARDALFDYNRRRAGEAAFNEGLGVDACPFPTGVSAGRSWLAGYEAAAHEAAQSAIAVAQSLARLNPRLPWPTPAVV